MANVKVVQTSFTRGELSTRLDGRIDLEAYFQGAKKLRNCHVLPQGGVERRPGLRYNVTVKDSNVAIIIPWIRSRTLCYFLEIGEQYMRFIDIDMNQVEISAGVPYEIVTPWTSAQLKDLQWRQSVDVMYFAHPDVAPQKLSRIANADWTIATISHQPPPSFEADEDLNVTGVPSANTGTITFRSPGNFLAGDVDRQIVIGAGRGIITAIPSVDEATVDMLDDFDQTITAGPNTLTTVGTAMASTAHNLSVGDGVVLTSGAQSGEIRIVATVTDADNVVLDAAFSLDQTAQTWNGVEPVAAGGWLLRGTSGVTLDPDKKEPVNGQITLTAGAAAFRASVVGKYIKIYDGVVEVTAFTSTTVVVGEIKSILSRIPDDKANNPDPAPAGSWTLEEPSWSALRGFPAAIEFHQGRLYYAATEAQPTTIWGSRTDNYENFATGALATDAVEFTHAARQLNAIEWLAHDNDLYFATTENEHVALGPGENEAIGGDVTPIIRSIGEEGAMSRQPVVLTNGVIYLGANAAQVFILGYNLESDSTEPEDMTVFAEHLFRMPLAQAQPSWIKGPQSRMHFPRMDGKLIVLTFRPRERILAWTQYDTPGADGVIEWVAAIPHPDGDRYRLGMVVKRTIDGNTVRYIEYVEDDALELSARAWKELHTDSAVIYDGSATDTITGLSHLEGETVQVLADGSFQGTKVVASGQITLDSAASKVEVGLAYNTEIEPMRPASQGGELEGRPRKWNRLALRVENTIGGKLNGEQLHYDAVNDDIAPFTGLVRCHHEGIDEDGFITILQDQPYPMTVLQLFGSLAAGDHM